MSFAPYGTASQLDKTVRLYRKQYEGANTTMVGYHEPMNGANDSKLESDEQRRDAENQGAMHHHKYR